MKSTYWYKITCFYCPLCGSERRYRERQHTKKPKNLLERYEEFEYYDYCDAL